jgi:hypothetical protein
MAGLVLACPGHPRRSAQRMTGSGLHGRRALFSEPLLLVAAMSASSLRRAAWVAWNKPGHNGKAVRGTVTGRRPTADAIRVVIVVAKTRKRCYQYWCWPNHSPLGASWGKWEGQRAV